MDRIDKPNVPNTDTPRTSNSPLSYLLFITSPGFRNRTEDTIYYSIYRTLEELCRGSEILRRVHRPLYFKSQRRKRCWRSPVVPFTAVVIFIYTGYFESKNSISLSTITTFRMVSLKAEFRIYFKKVSRSLVKIVTMENVNRAYKKILRVNSFKPDRAAIELTSYGT